MNEKKKHNCSSSNKVLNIKDLPKYQAKHCNPATLQVSSCGNGR